MPDYSTDSGLLEHLQKQNQSIDQYKSEAGADSADITELNNDTNNMEAMMEYCPLVDEFKTTAYGMKRTLIRGNIGDSVGEMMTAPTFTPTAPLVAGIEKRSRERDGRWKRAKTMTEAAMLALDLVDTPNNLSPESVQPTIQVSGAQTGYLFTVNVSGRGNADMWDVLILRKGSSTWTYVKTATGKSIDVVVQPTTPGEAEQMQVRVQLKKNNANYGQPSAIVYVTINP